MMVISLLILILQYTGPPGPPGGTRLGPGGKRKIYLLEKIC